ncbi:hypothetical protein [Clostridium beijerinckii]|nr:hypothetical protein [Clostridium beijerinckii]
MKRGDFYGSFKESLIKDAVTNYRLIYKMGGTNKGANHFHKTQVYQ